MHSYYKLSRLIAMACMVHQFAVAKLIDKIVARVGDEIILYSDLQQAKSNVSEYTEITGQEIEPSDRAVLEQLVNQKLVRQEMNKRGMEPEESDISSAVASVMAENNLSSQGELEAILRQEGVGFTEYRENLKKQIRQSRLMNWIIKPRTQKVTDEAVEEKLQNRYPEGREVLEKEVYLIFKSSDEKAQKKLTQLAEKIKNKTDFVAIAQKETQGPSKEEGGALGFVAPESLQAEYALALKDMQPGTMSEVIQTPQGYALIYVADERSVKKPISDTERQEMRAELERQAQAKAFDRFIVELRNKNTVDIKDLE